MTSKTLPWQSLTAESLFLKFLLITQHEMPFINMSEGTKRSSNRTGNGKCTDVTNCRSRVGLSTPIYTNHRYNYKTLDLFWWVFSLSCIFTDFIMRNYRVNQSALMTRCRTESQTSTQNATCAESEEGRLFLQASFLRALRIYFLCSEENYTIAPGEVNAIFFITVSAFHGWRQT